MVVVADSSPIIVLVGIDHIHIVPRLFGSAIVPSQVAVELRHPKRPSPVRDFMKSPPDWLSERTPLHIHPIASLHAGETAAISLAQELNADLLLID